ncbi:MAG: hypothetical protein K1X51_05175 [Rhodospirillaceae bacterium]|nr:hypothetical protein [Rhodospirillaceae bacterium]
MKSMSSQLTRRNSLAAFLSALFYAPVCGANEIGSCKGNTVEDARGVQFASEARAFFATLRSIVADDDKEAFALLVRYPVAVSGTSEPKTISNSADLLKRYPAIVTPELKHAVIAQEPQCLFANYQGVMVGNGEIWFEKENGGKFGIITLNVPARK